MATWQRGARDSWPNLRLLGPALTLGPCSRSAPECILQPQWAGSQVRLCPNPQCPRNDTVGPLLRLSNWRTSGAAVQFVDAAPSAATVPTAATSLGRLGLAPLLATRAAAEEAAEAAAQRSPRPALRSPTARPRGGLKPNALRAPPASPVVSPPRSPVMPPAVAPVTPPPATLPLQLRAPAPMPPPLRVNRAFVSETDLFGGFDDDVWAPNANCAPVQPQPDQATWTDSSVDSLASLALSEEADEGMAAPAPPPGKLIRRDSEYDASDDLDGDSNDAWGSRVARHSSSNRAVLAADGTMRIGDLVAATRRSTQALAEQEYEEDSSRWYDTV